MFSVFVVVVVRKVITFCGREIGGGHLPVSTGVLTHRFFSFRKKTARSCPRGGIGRLVTIFGSLFWHFFELLKNKVLTWSGVGPSKSGRSGDF